mmetsp:Transcript_8368/g.19416  ORF Transcript_8368/g.19416 Transcript_8368/m.19416 type:complete len:249 (+) Transcript_8368:78-824(+)
MTTHSAAMHQLSTNPTMIPSTAAAAAAALRLAPASLLVRGGAAAMEYPLENATNLRKLSGGGDGSNVLRRYYQAFWVLPETIRYVVSVNIGSVLFFLLDRLLYLWVTQHSQRLPPVVVHYKTSVSYFSAYALQIVAQQWLLASLVYGMETINTRKKYYRSLLNVFQTYFVSMVGSTVLNATLIKHGVNRTVSFVGTLGIFAIFNYFVLKWIMETPSVETSRKSLTVHREDSNTITATAGGNAQAVKDL